jgi:DNA polymerase III alpha subunit (gram-positive type)
MIKANYIVYDTETGGLDKEKNPITQFACVVLDYKTLKEIDRWETFIKPYNDLIIEKEALEHTMVSMSDINNGISLKKFIKRCMTVAD